MERLCHYDEDSIDHTKRSKQRVRLNLAVWKLLNQVKSSMKIRTRSLNLLEQKMKKHFKQKASENFVSGNFRLPDLTLHLQIRVRLEFSTYAEE